jgi:hypothetical protein
MCERGVLIWNAGGGAMQNAKAHGLITVTMLFIGCNVADPRQPFPLGTPSEPQHSGEQAEVATTLARSLNNQDVLIAAYRYTGTTTIPESNGTHDIDYGPNNSVVIHHGASIAGISRSLDGGFVWSPGTKFYPTPMNTFGDPVAVLWADSAVTDGYVNPSFVAYSTLAISQAAFDSVKQNDNAVHFWPGGGNGGIIDSVCALLSFDGGFSFPNIFCKLPDGIGADGTDQTSIGIGKNDRVFIVTDDFGNQELRLYETGPQVLGGFLPIAIDPQMGFSTHTPRITRDQDGELWLAASRSDTNDVRLCHIRPGTQNSAGGCDFVGVVTQMAEPFPILQKSNIGAVRTGLTVSFAANRIQALIPATDFYFVYQVAVPDGMGKNILHIGATQCRLTGVSPFTCYDVPSWGSGSSAQQFQPAIAFSDLSESGNGTQPHVEYAFYDIDDIANGVAVQHARVRRAVLNGGPFSGLPPNQTFATFENLPFASDPMVCTAKYGPSLEYWGDFFGYQVVGGRHVAIYSSDEDLGCSQTNNFQGQLHLQSWFWPN